MGVLGFLSAALRPGHPDFLDLPWEHPLSDWAGRTSRLEDLPRGESRHPVVFVGYEEGIYALKALPPGRAEQEYELLKGMEEQRLPVVEPVGRISAATPAGESSVLVTRYLERSLPYQALFLQADLHRYRDQMLDALAGLLVQLHLAGAYWGDCSLANTLFRRDAAALEAFLVDAETSELTESLSELRRHHDLDVMEENVGGALYDLLALGALPPGLEGPATGQQVRRRYEELWREINAELVIGKGDSYQIQERVRRLNALGFSVGEIALAEAGGQLRLKVLVTDRHFHRDRLLSLTGLDAGERQAELLMNEVQRVRMVLSEERQRSTSLTAAAFHWRERIYGPAVEQLKLALGPELSAVERYCELLEHKWFLSERARADVGLAAALEDYVRRFAPADQGAK